MSWNFWMEMSAGGTEPCQLAGFEGNYTYNVAPMYYEAFPGESGIRGIDGMTGEQAGERLRQARTNLLLNRDHYEKMNPENGWGDYVGALELIKILEVWCDQAPTAILRVV